MNHWFLLVVCALAVFRLAYFISEERGPGWVALKFRRFVKRQAPKKTHLDEGIECPYCCQLWIAILVSLFLSFYEKLPVWAAFLGRFAICFLALGGAAVLLHQVFVWLRRE